MIFIDNVFYISWSPIYRICLLNGLYIYIYSLMFIISFVTGWEIIRYMYKSDGIDVEFLHPLLRYTFFGTLLGARLGEIIFYDFSYFSNHLIEAVLPIKENNNYCLFGLIDGYKFVGYQGLSSHGAAIGILLSNFLYNKKFIKEKSFIWICDRLCIPTILSASLIRIGNFFNSEIIGRPCNFFWCVRFLQMNSKHGNKMIPRHPTQIYESIIYFSIFMLLFYTYHKNKKKNHEGLLTGMFFSFSWVSRFLLEFLKEPQENEFINFFKLNTGQLLSIPFIIFGILLIFLSKKKDNYIKI